MFSRKGAGSKATNSNNLEKLRNETKQFSAKKLGENGTPVPDMEMNSCNDAVKHVFEEIKISDSMDVIIRISVSNGVQIFSSEKDILAYYDLKSIPFCFVSEDFPRVFAFLSHEKGNMQCFVFQCVDETEANDLYYEMSKIFEKAAKVEQYEVDKKETRLFSYMRGKNGPCAYSEKKRLARKQNNDSSNDIVGMLGSQFDSETETDGLLDGAVGF